MRIRFGLILKITGGRNLINLSNNAISQNTRITSEIITLFRIPPQLFLPKMRYFTKHPESQTKLPFFSGSLPNYSAPSKPSTLLHLPNHLRQKL